MASPLYRQEQEWARQGLKLSRQTMSNWVLRAAEDHLLPVYEELRQQLVKREVLHADETTLQVFYEPGKKAQTKSYMWLYRTRACLKIVNTPNRLARRKNSLPLGILPIFKRRLAGTADRPSCSTSTSPIGRRSMQRSSWRAFPGISTRTATRATTNCRKISG